MHDVEHLSVYHLSMVGAVVVSSLHALGRHHLCVAILEGAIAAVHIIVIVVLVASCLSTSGNSNRNKQQQR